MAATSYSELNTQLDMLHDRLLTPDQFNQLLNPSATAQSIARVLEDTDYQFTTEDLEDVDKIEKGLMTSLIQTYRFIYNEAPDVQLIDVIGLIYMYHNLKVILKKMVAEVDIEHLLIPIGHYSYDQLYHVVQTQESSVIPPSVVESVASTIQDYEVYKDAQAIDVGMDMAYFDHLREIANQLDTPLVTHLVDLRIDFYNIISVLRAKKQDQSRAFMIEAISEQGNLTYQQVIEMVNNQQIARWFDRFTQLPFDRRFDEVVEKMKLGTVTASDMEKLVNDYTYQFLYDKRLTGHGPEPVLLYLILREFEVTNLRLILTGRVMGLDRSAIEERMRPIYGQEI